MLLKYNFLILSFVLTLFSGCASTSIKPGDNIELKKNEGVLFGLIEHHFYDFDGSILTTERNSKFSYSIKYGKSNRGWLEKNYTPMKIFSETLISGNTRSLDKLFVQSLSTGSYSMEEMILDMGQLNITFELPKINWIVKPKKATYIGNIVMDFMPVENIFGGTEYNLTKITIIDKQKEVENDYKSKYSTFPHEVLNGVTEKSKIMNASVLKNFLKNLGQ